MSFCRWQNLCCVWRQSVLIIITTFSGEYRMVELRVMVMVFNATFNNISVGCLWFYPYLQMYPFYRVYRRCCSHILVLYWFVVLTHPKTRDNAMVKRKRAKYKQLSTKHYIEQEEFEDTKGIIRTVNRHLRLSRFISSSIFSFMCMLCRSLFVLFLLAIVLSVLLRFTVLIIQHRR
jgi:hypothetical protein